MGFGTKVVVFGPFRIDTLEQSLWTGTQRLKITTKSLALLQHLVRNAGRIVTKEELLRVIWADTHVDSRIIKTLVAEIRRVLGDNAYSPRFIEAVPRRGYRFIASVGVGNIPIPAGTFVGRERELAGTRRLLEHCRLVTLRGPAGVGKTRLAIEVASRIVSDLSCCVWWADLSSVVDSDLVAHTLASATFVGDSAGRPIIDNLADEIGERRIILVLDNCEHLIDACASVVDTLLDRCPNLKVLTTSREPLGIAGESAYSVAPLSLPDSWERAADVLTADAVRLFVERAKHADGSFTMSDDNASAVATICRRLDGLPLAIELVAVRVNVLAPEQIVARLDDVFALLGSASRLESPRHQTLKAALDWSYDLLSLKEGRLLASLSVFAGSFTLGAVEAVCGDTDEFTTEELLDLIARLVNRSLVVPASDRLVKEMRYRLLDTVRQYSRQKLLPSDEQRLAARHADFFVRVAEEVAPFVNGAASASYLARLDRDRDNFRAALRWGLTVEAGRETAIRLTAALWLYWLRRGQRREGRSWLEASLRTTSGVPADVRADALCGAGILAWLERDFEEARRHLEESVALSRTTDNPTGLGRALYYLSLSIAYSGDVTVGERLAEEAVQRLRCAASPWDLATALAGLGQVRRLQGRLLDAVPPCEESAAILRMIPDPWTLSYPLRELAMIAASENDYDRAEECWRESLAALRPLDETWFLCVAVRGMAEVAVARGDYLKAVRLAGAAESLQKADELPAVDRTDAGRERLVTELRRALDQTAFQNGWAIGQQLSRDEAINLALGRSVPRSA